MRLAAAIGIVLMATACSTPHFVDRADGTLVPAAWPNQVFYRVSPAFAAAPPACVSIAPLRGDAADATRIRAALYAQLAPRVGQPPIGASGDACDTVISGDVLELSTQFLGIYSRTAVGARLQMTRGAVVLWEGEHVASTYGGAVPLDPFSVISAVFSAAGNVDDESLATVVDVMARRLVSTIPDMTNTAPTVLATVDGAAGDKGAAASEAPAVAYDPAGAMYLSGAKILAAAGYYPEAIEAYRRSGAAFAAAGDLDRAQDVLTELNRAATR